MDNGCQKASYRMLKVYVDGEKQRCRKRALVPKSAVRKNPIVPINATRTMSLDDLTVVEGVQVINVTRAETPIGRHKFNRG